MKAILRARRTVSTATLARIRGTLGLPLEDELRLAERDPVAWLERRTLDPASVHLDSVRRAEVDDHVRIAVAPELRVLARDVRVGDLHLALARASDHGAVGSHLAAVVAVHEK